MVSFKLLYKSQERIKHAILQSPRRLSCNKNKKISCKEAGKCLRLRQHSAVLEKTFSQTSLKDIKSSLCSVIIQDTTGGSTQIISEDWIKIRCFGRVGCQKLFILQHNKRVTKMLLFRSLDRGNWVLCACCASVGTQGEKKKKIKPNPECGTGCRIQLPDKNKHQALV